MGFDRLDMVNPKTVEKELGQTLVEYALVITMISIGALTVLATMTSRVTAVFNALGSAL
jgi:Flp pilus assembly pilin Flp